MAKQAEKQVENDQEPQSVYEYFVDAKKVPLPENAEVKGNAEMFDLNKFPRGKRLSGIFKRCFKTKSFGTGDQTRQGTGIEIIPDGAKHGIGLGVCASLRGGLEISGDGDNATSNNIGKRVHIEYKGKAPNKKGQAAHQFIVAVEV
jgi:hypothetical protein